MAQTDFIIKKLEKGPLQRFKNSNLLMKKFGELGLQIYRVITGKRTTEELRRDLDIEKENFDAIIEYMKEAGMVELVPAGTSTEEEKPQKERAEIEEPRTSTAKTPEADLFIEPADAQSMGDEEEQKPAPQAKKRRIEEEPAPDLRLEIEPELTPDEAVEEAADTSDEPPPPDPSEEQTPSEEPVFEQADESVDLGSEEPEEPREESTLNTAERMIKERFGELGLKVYALIDGTRTTQEIMDETGVSDTKLVEILNFLEERGIIKMEERDRSAAATQPSAAKEEELGDVLAPDEDIAGVDPRGFPTIDIPIKSNVDIVRTIKIKADVLLKFGDRGTRVFESIDGKRDVLDISLIHNMALYELFDIINFLFARGAIILKPLKRLDIKRKYGDAGFSVYKKYGRDGVLLYELIDKNLSIKQMADRVTKDKDRFLELFLFIRKVLNIEIPIDKEVLMKQLA